MQTGLLRGRYLSHDTTSHDVVQLTRASMKAGLDPAASTDVLVAISEAFPAGGILSVASL